MSFIHLIHSVLQVGQWGPANRECPGVSGSGTSKLGCVSGFHVYTLYPCHGVLVLPSADRADFLFSETYVWWESDLYWVSGEVEVQEQDCCSVAESCLTLCDAMDCSTPDIPVFHYLPDLLRFMFIESVMLSNHHILCCPLLLLPSIKSKEVIRKSKESTS